MNNRYSYFIIGYTIITVVLFLSACSRDTDVPKELIGIWKTAAPQYEDRHLTIDENYITLGLGAEGEVSYIIKNIESRKKDSGTSYTFYYEDSEGEEWTLAFYYESSNNGFIILNNSENVWKKMNSGA